MKYINPKIKHPGMIVNHDGYLRIKRGPLRDQMAHRAYAARQIGVEKLPSEFEIHHICMNRCCWPPTDFHLMVVDQALAPYMYQTYAKKMQRQKSTRGRR